VIRLNFLEPDRIVSLAVLREVVLVPQVRRVLTVAAAIGAFLLVVWGVEALRLHIAQSHYAELQQRYGVIALQRKRIEGVIAQVHTLSVLRSQIVDIRNSGAVRASELVEIGNHLPPSVFLDAIHPAGDTWQLTGHTKSIDDLGMAVHALENVGGGSPRLLEFHQTGKKGDDLLYAIDLERVIH
jgi:hypothetical protein